MSDGFSIVTFPGSIVSKDDQINHNPGIPFTFIVTVVLKSPDDEQPFLTQWEKLAALFKSKSGYISGQLYQGCPNKDGLNNILVLVAVWQSTDAYVAAGKDAAALNIIAGFPSGIVEYQVMATKIAVPGFCTASE